MTALSRKQWLIILGALIVAFYVAFGVIERSLPDGTPGVIQYEFVGNEDRAAEMLAEWGDAGQDDIRLSLWIDYGFMLVYGAFFTLAGLATRDFAREHGKQALASVGRWAPWCAIAAALFDALENANLLLILGGHGGSISPPLATACASIKFLLITIAVVYAVWGLVAKLSLRDT
jgi:hypothetical protein